MATLKDAFAWNLKRLLEEKKESQTELVKALKVSFPTVNAAVNARVGVSEKFLRACAKHFGVEETELVRRPNWPVRADLKELIEYMHYVEWTPTRIEVVRSVLTGFVVSSEKKSLEAVDKLSKPGEKRK